LNTTGSSIGTWEVLTWCDICLTVGTEVTGWACASVATASICVTLATVLAWIAEADVNILNR